MMICGQETMKEQVSMVEDVPRKELMLDKRAKGQVLRILRPSLRQAPVLGVRLLFGH